MRCSTAMIALSLLASNAMAENVSSGQARQAGVSKCLPAIEAVTDTIIGDGNAGAHSVWHKEDPDSTGFTSAIERNFGNGIVLTNVNVVPTGNGECYVEYQRIANTDASCLATAKGLDDAEYQGEINQEVAILERQGLTVYLIPNGTRCTVVSKEVIMDGLQVLTGNEDE